jgi:predicted nucleic acid-binding protein
MPCYYFDTSALAKRYSQEAGTVWVIALTDPALGHEIYTAQLTGPEMVATLFRRVRSGKVSLAKARRLVGNFRMDWQQQYQPLEVSESVINEAMRLAERHALRGADAIHLAATLELHQRRQMLQLPPLTFVSADVEQIKAAQAEGLPIENPDNHA